jgi:predicted nucleic acid-binding protein
MANIFLDTNYIFDIFERNVLKRSILAEHRVFISPLSYHIYVYTAKKKVPDSFLIDSLQDLTMVDLTSDILLKALHQPTSDLEDNIQLHSASSARCDYFLTSDKQLLKIKYFGQVEIVDKI